MSGWDASSRPIWDPQGGEGESTQSFGVPDSWNSPQEPPEDGGFPGSASPGTPPDIFLQDYDSNDFAPNDFAPNGVAPNGVAPSGAAPNGVGRHAAPQHMNNGHSGRVEQDPFQRDSAPWDRDQEDYPGPGYGAPEPPQRPDLPRPDLPRPDFSQRPDLPQRPERSQRPERTQRPERSQRPERLDRPDPRDRGYADPLAYRDSDQAARVDPALRDFFEPQPARPDTGRQAPGQQRHGASGYAGQSRDPWGLPPDDRDPYQDSPPRRPGPRSGHRQEAPPRRSGLTALVVVAVVVVIGIGIGGYLLLNRGNTTTPQTTGGGPTATPTSSPQATKAAPAPPAKTVAYTLTTPATAGGYPKLATIPSAVQAAASPVTQGVENAAVSQDGGKVTGHVDAAYQLSSGQVLAFAGFTGTFDPAKVMASLASLGTHSHPGTAGPHGGMLACATAPGSPNGTVCVWVTTTTLGVTEFFSKSGPEVVTDQAKAAEDTLNFRNSAEQPK